MAEPADTARKTCFVAMPVATPPSYANDLRDTDHFGHVLDHLFTPALEQAGYIAIPPKMLGATLIHAEIIGHLEQADLVLADLSSHNPNVFFELGLRTSLDRPVVLVKDKRTTKIPFDLGTVNVLDYDESIAPWTLKAEIKRLAEHISNVPTDSDSGNAMWKYFGLTKRGGPAKAGSVEEMFDLILAEITKTRLAPPDVTSVEPTSGSAAGGTNVAVTGTGFSGAAAVYFGTVAARFTVVSDTQLIVTSPPGIAGTMVDVTITTSAGTSSISPADRFAFA